MLICFILCCIWFCLYVFVDSAGDGEKVFVDARGVEMDNLLSFNLYHQKRFEHDKTILIFEVCENDCDKGYFKDGHRIEIGAADEEICGYD